MDGNYSTRMENILHMLEEGDFEIVDLLKLKYEVDYHVAAYFESLQLPPQGSVLKGETAKQLNKGLHNQEKLKERKERFLKGGKAAAKPKIEEEVKKNKKWHGTVYVSGLPCEGKDSDGSYVHNLLERYSHTINIKYIYIKEKKNRGAWNGDLIVLLADLEAKKKLIEQGFYLPEHEKYKSAKVEHHQKIKWSEDDSVLG